MESSARDANAGGPSPGQGDGQGDSPLAKLSGLGDRLRTRAEERLGPDPGQRLKAATGEKLQSVGDRLPEGAADRLRGVTGGAAGDQAGTPVPAPPFEERPELYVGAAFAGGLVLAGVIRLLAR